MKKFVKKLVKLFLIAIIALVVLIAVIVGGVFLLRGRVNHFSKSYFSDKQNKEDAMQQIQLESGEEIQTLEDGLLVVRLDGDDSLDAFLEQGGASTDQELLEFITSYMKTADNLSIETAGFGCSTLQAPAVDGGYYFGRKEFLHPLSIEGFCVEGLIDYQFRQLSKQSFEILLEAGENANQNKIKQEVIAQMNSILKQKKLRDIYFEVRFAERIVADLKTGKKPLVIPLERRG